MALCSPVVRLAVRRLLLRQAPRVPVLAYTAIAPGVDLTVDGVVGLEC